MQTLSEELLTYFTQLPEQNQREVIAIIKSYTQDDERPQTLEEYNKELEEANAEIEAGIYVDHEEVMDRYFKRS